MCKYYVNSIQFTVDSTYSVTKLVMDCLRYIQIMRLFYAYSNKTVLSFLKVEIPIKELQSKLKTFQETGIARHCVFFPANLSQLLSDLVRR